MLFLLLAIGSSALISILMRLSAEKTSGGVGMLAMNYLMCAALSAFYAGGSGSFFPQSASLGQTVGLGAVHGLLMLAGFVLLQVNVRRSGVVLPAIFMKLGLLIPLVMSIVFFREVPTAAECVGFCLAVGAIILINLKKDESSRFGWGLILLLLSGGLADAMCKVYEELGDPALSEHFLLYTFIAASVLCIILTAVKKEWPGKSEVLFGCIIGVPNFFCSRFLLRALDTMDAVIVYPTFSVATILVVTLVGLAAFGERLSRRQWVAVAIILLALVLLNLPA